MPRLDYVIAGETWRNRIPLQATAPCFLACIGAVVFGLWLTAPGAYDPAFAFGVKTLEELNYLLCAGWVFLVNAAFVTLIAFGWVLTTRQSRPRARPVADAAAIAVVTVSTGGGLSLIGGFIMGAMHPRDDPMILFALWAATTLPPCCASLLVVRRMRATAA